MSATPEQITQARDDARKLVSVGLKDVTDWLEMAGLVVAKPIPFCDSRVRITKQRRPAVDYLPPGSYVCLRSPHPDNDDHVYVTRKRRDG